jgi:UDP:flavonoid glycosyltransferase YjiC (YdhE family)
MLNLTLCREADLVVIPTAVAAGKNEAELLNLPSLSVSLMPWAIPWDDPERPIFKRIIYRAIDKLVSLLTTQPLNRIRKRQGLPPVGEEGFRSPRLNLVPVSPAVFPPNPHWNPHHRVVGYWFAETPTEWQPPKDLLAFLDNGEPPLMVSLGAMSLGEEDAQESASLFVDTIQRTGVRAIIQGWQSGMKQLMLPPCIFAAGSLPHRWLLPRCTGIVHHGGYGTTAAGLQAGIPALVIPHIADQFYWGQCVHQLSLGPPPIPRPKLTGENLATVLQELVHNKQFHDAACKIGMQIRSEDGIGNAVNLIEEFYLV